MGVAVTSIRPSSVVADTGDVASATNAAAAVTYAADTNLGHVVSGIAWSYSGAPTGGGLTVTAGGSTVFSIDITAAGPGFFPFNPYKRTNKNVALVVTLAAGGSGVVGKVSVINHWTESP